MLTRGIQIADSSGEHQIAAGLLNNLGNYHAAQGNFSDAVEHYLQGARRSRANGHALQEARALANAARAALDDGRVTLAAQLVNDSYTNVQLLPDNNQKAYLLIHTGKTYQRLAAKSSEAGDRHLLNAHAALTDAVKLATKMDDLRSLSYAQGNLGALYLSENRTSEALFLTRKARRAADAAEAPESLYRWYWQEGKIHWAQGHANQAIAAYERAVAVLEETRQDSKVQYGSSESYFKNSVAPVYMDLVKALLAGSELLGDRREAVSLLLDARQTVERYKAAELRDYFRDQCVAEVETSERHLDEVAAGAAIIYPIPLGDRTELLVKLPSGIERYTMPVGEAEIREQSLRLRSALQDAYSDRYLKPSRLLYKWLVAPYAAELEKQNVTTLVFVPDGALRTIPMAALHDGKEFLSAHYALAVAPSLGLIAPKAFDPKNARVLLAGVSESVQGFPALNFVPDELNAVREIYGGDILLDEDFQVESIESAMASIKPSVVHLASHAVFSGEASSSFLLTHDGKMDMDHLSSMIGKARLRGEPVELLILSACETAAGNDRAALGLAGVAIRAGARSAVGSLWSISDEATSELVVEFYKQLGNTSLSKAQALSRAQAKLRDSERFAHPFYWSPFLMINNWL
ncbi:MAG: CHAT domain-containing protein [Deltaproteobacteria bacterium]|nr:CHAT domain-containing protein [Deltaproteobacteria bacterium]